jgi:hypothetical protein
MALGYWQPVLMDFFESDNDGLYALFMFVAVGFAIVLILMVTRASRQADQARRATKTADALNTAPVDAIADTSTPTGLPQ